MSDTADKTLTLVSSVFIIEIKLKTSTTRKIGKEYKNIEKVLILIMAQRIPKMKSRIDSAKEIQDIIRLAFTFLGSFAICVFVFDSKHPHFVQMTASSSTLFPHLVQNIFFPPKVFVGYAKHNNATY